MKPEKPSNELVRLIRAFGYSLQGLKAALLQPAFRIELLCAAVLIPTALYVEHRAVRCALLISSVMLVLIVELLNSGIEAAIDRISADFHPLSKIAKDVGSAAVLLSLLNAAMVWLCIFLLG